MSETCRTCLLEIPDTTCFMLNKKDVKSKAVRAELRTCVPELRLDLVKDPVICRNCVNILQLSYNFKTRCLRTEIRIRNCLKSAKLNGKRLNLTKLLSMETNAPKNCSAVEDSGDISRNPTVGERCATQPRRASLDIQADNDEHERTDNCTASTVNEDSNVVMKSEIIIVDGEDENDLRNIITNDGAIMGLPAQPLEFRDKILERSSAATCTNILGEMSQDFDNMIVNHIVIKDHELLTFKVEADEASSLKNETAVDGGSKGSNYYKTNTPSEDDDVTENTRSIANGPDGNNLIDGECEFPADNAVQCRTNVYISFTANEDFNIINSNVSTVDGEKTRSITCDTGGNNLVDGAYKFDDNKPQNLYNETKECYVGAANTNIANEKLQSVKNESSNHEDETNLHSPSSPRKVDNAYPISGDQISQGTHNTDEDSIIKEEHNLESFKTEEPLNTKPFRCSVCDFSTACNKQLTIHLRIHADKRPHHCNICDYRAALKRTLNNHMRTHTGERPFRCNVCDARLKQKVSLDVHMRRHTTEKPFRCNICDFSTAYKNSLTTHMHIHADEKPLQCNVCDYRTIQQESLNIHMRKHTGEKSFYCDVCGLGFRSKAALIYHMQTHTGEKPFRCDVCNLRLTSKSNLTKHLLTHTGEKRFRCKVCGFRVTRKTDLIGHALSHTGERRFRCNVCDFRLIRKADLVKHMRTHTGEKPYCCNVCGFRTAVKGNLNLHMRKYCRKAILSEK